MFIEEYIARPYDPIKITVHGVGGNGSIMLENLANINKVLKMMGHVGLKVIAIDDDRIEEHNLRSRMFTEWDIGQYKADVIIDRLNTKYNTDWVSKTNIDYDYDKHCPNIVITCTDSIVSRVNIINKYRNVDGDSNKILRDSNLLYYWLDIGNKSNTGQAIIGTVDKASTDEHYLKNAFDIFQPDMNNKKEDTPSCSLAEALFKQSLYINAITVDFASKMLFDYLTKKEIDYHGVLVNLKTCNTSKLYI